MNNTLTIDEMRLIITILSQVQVPIMQAPPVLAIIQKLQMMATAPPTA